MQKFKTNTDINDLEGEIWRDIVIYKNGKLYDFTGMYQVSNKGRVKSLDKEVKHHSNLSKKDGTRICKGKIRKQEISKDGYLNVSLFNGNIKVIFRVHRLVATAFIPNPENKPEVNHKNKIKTDNSVENLEWNTSSENQYHRNSDGTNCGEKNGSSRKVLCITTNKTFGCITEAGKYYNLNDKNGHSHIGDCCLGKRKYCGKLQDGTKLEWRYVDEQ